MKKIILALFLACTAAGAQTGCTVAGGVTCSPNLNLWLLPPHYANWGIPWNDNATAVDTFTTTVVLFAPTGSQTVTQPFSTFFNVSNPLVFGSTPNIRFGTAAGSYDTILSRAGAGVLSLDTTAPGNGAGTLYLAGLKVNGTAGTSGQCLASNGTVYNTPVDCASVGTLYYQTVASNGTAVTQRPTLDFSAYFQFADTASPAETIVSPVTTGSEGKLVTAGSAGTSGHCTAWDANGGVADSGSPCFGGTVTQKNCLSVACAGGTIYASGTSYTNSSGAAVLEEVTMTSYLGGGGTGGDSKITSLINGQSGPANGVWNQCNGVASITFMVPAGDTFSADAAAIDGCGGGTQTITSWLELQL